ncbi:MAG: OmpA family protein [Rhizomicrobium sp.]
MAFEFSGMTKYLARASAIAVIGFGAGACSVIPDWMGGSATSASTPDDQADQQATQNAPAPDLSAVPDKPGAPSTPDQQDALANSLGADRAQNQYSSDALRGGTEAAAPPPGAPPPTNEVASATTPSQPAPTAAAPSADSGSIDVAAAANATPAAPAPVPPATQTADNSAPPSTEAAPPPSAAQTAPPPAVAPSSGGAAVPAGSYGTYGVSASMVSPSDAALGFKPSEAPPLSASVGQFVPQPIIARYQQTAQMSRSAYSVSGRSAYSAAPVSNRAKGGAVLASVDSPQAPPMTTYMGGGAPSAVVAFSGNRTILSAEAKAQVRAAAAAFLQGGGQGFVRVVGHATSAGSLSSERRMVLNFEHSQARATAVARELIKDGVPANKVLVQTSGGADSGASAEIFLQS